MGASLTAWLAAPRAPAPAPTPEDDFGIRRVSSSGGGSGRQTQVVTLAGNARWESEPRRRGAPPSPRPAVPTAACLFLHAAPRRLQHEVAQRWPGEVRSRWCERWRI